jgi:hypothetical protein
MKEFPIGLYIILLVSESFGLICLIVMTLWGYGFISKYKGQSNDDFISKNKKIIRILAPIGVVLIIYKIVSNIIILKSQ